MCAAPLWAQLEGSVKGTAKGQDGKPIAGATVVFYDAVDGPKVRDQDQRQGRVLVIGVYIGTYKCTLMQNGNPIDEQNNIPIGGGQEQVVELG